MVNAHVIQKNAKNFNQKEGETYKWVHDDRYLQ